MSRAHARLQPISREKMLYRQWFAALAMAALPFAVCAQQNQTYPDVTNPAAPTAPLRYESVFSTYQSSKEDESTPDTVWRSANDAMGTLGGHVAQVNGNAKANADSVVEPARGRATNAKADDKPDARPEGKPADHSKHH
jgi:hypothetical protein